jgi:hypothetical protein
MPGLTTPKQGLNQGSSTAAPKRAPLRWGDPGVSERFIVQDTTMIPQPNQQSDILADAGILAALRLHVFGTVTITHGTGTNGKDPWGPYNLYQNLQFVAGSNTPIVNMSGTMAGILQVIEWPGRTWEASATPQGTQAPAAVSDMFNFPSATGTLRFWIGIPLALPWAGMPGGAVGYVILQNKKIANVLKATYNMSGAASPYSMFTALSLPNRASAYQATGNDTIVGALTNEVWKELYTVPDSPSKMPRFGFTRYLQEVGFPYAGTSFTYNFEPGGVLLRAIFSVFDAGAGTAGTGTGVATTNVQFITYQYGTNKQVDVYSPYRNILEENDIYGRFLPQGVYALDYYTRKRNLTDAKSTENIANVQAVVTFTSGYNPPANSVVYILLDKVYIVQQRLAR